MKKPRIFESDYLNAVKQINGQNHAPHEMINFYVKTVYWYKLLHEKEFTVTGNRMEYAELKFRRVWGECNGIFGRFKLTTPIVIIPDDSNDF